MLPKHNILVHIHKNKEDTYIDVFLLVYIIVVKILLGKRTGKGEEGKGLVRGRR